MAIRVIIVTCLLRKKAWQYQRKAQPAACRTSGIFFCETGARGMRQQERDSNRQRRVPTMMSTCATCQALLIPRACWGGTPNCTRYRRTVRSLLNVLAAGAELLSMYRYETYEYSTRLYPHPASRGRCTVLYRTGSCKCSRSNYSTEVIIGLRVQYCRL